MKVLATELYDKGYNQLLKDLMQGFEEEPLNKLISPSDANVLVMGYQDPKLQAVLDDFLNIPDGVPSVWVGKFKGAKEMNRCSGPDLFRELLEITKDKSINHYFIGGQQNTLDKLRDVTQNELGNSHVAGTYSPPFKEFSEDEIRLMAEQCNKAKADVIWVGLGAPKQITFSHTLAKYSKAYYIIPVGAAFDFLAGNVVKAPQWVQKIGLEWAFRITQQPQRMGRRYLNIVPRFIAYNVREALHQTT